MKDHPNLQDRDRKTPILTGFGDPRIGSGFLAQSPMSRPSPKTRMKTFAVALIYAWEKMGMAPAAPAIRCSSSSLVMGWKFWATYMASGK